MRESQYQSTLIKKLRILFPGCLVIQTDPRQLQGIPDLLILYKDRWAMLEVKASRGASNRPNQEQYVMEFGEMSYASFITPETEEEVLYDLQRSFGSV